MYRPLSMLAVAGFSLALLACQPSENKGSTSSNASPAAEASAPATAESPAASPVAASSPAASQGAATSANVAALSAKGQQVYTANCASCHQGTGQGVPGAFPPLAGSEYTNGDATKHIQIVLNGLTGPVTVSGKQYNGAMPPWKQLSDDEIASVITYERTSWGNHGGAVTAAQIKAQR